MFCYNLRTVSVLSAVSRFPGRNGVRRDYDGESRMSVLLHRNCINLGVVRSGEM